jgi:yeast amino acid transporter
LLGRGNIVGAQIKFDAAHYSICTLKGINGQLDGQAPRFLLKCTKRGVPIYCVGTVSLITCITFLVCSTSAVKVFYWFVDLTTTGLIATYTAMLLVFIGWYRARKAQNFDTSQLTYIAPLTPWCAYFALLLGCLAILFIGFDVFQPWNTQSFITSYFCIPYSFVLYFGWKVIKGTKLVNPAEADLVSGKKEIDAECAIWEDGGIKENYIKALAEMSFLLRTWTKIWQ